jgi:type IV secretion system protein VirD4
MLTQNTEKSLSAMFDKLPLAHPAKAPYNLFAQASDTVRAGIVLGLGTRLQVLQNESIKNITCRSELDLSEPGRTKCAYFVILSDQESSTEFISSLFFSLLFIKLTRYADSQPAQRCKVPVNIVFEELNNVGQLDTYPRRLSVARSRSIQVCHVIQSLAQFVNRYPDEQWAEIIGNCDTQVMLGCTEEQTAKYWSMRSGDMSVEVNSTMTVRQTLAIAQMTPQYRYTEGLGKRRLLTPDEVFRLPNDEMLIIIRGQNMLRAKKFDYHGHPCANRLCRANILDYYPDIKHHHTENTIKPAGCELSAQKKNIKKRKTQPPDQRSIPSSQSQSEESGYLLSSAILIDPAYDPAENPVNGLIDDLTENLLDNSTDGLSENPVDNSTDDLNNNLFESFIISSAQPPDDF